MCLSPIKIPNPNRGLTFIRGDPRYLKDRQSGYLCIPCGHCSECIAKRQMDLVQRALMESTKNEFFFVTMTYNNETLPYVTTNDYDIYFADVRDVTNMFKRLKKYNALKYPFKHFGVSELGSKRGRPHFHLLLEFPKHYFKDFNDCINYETFLKQTLLANWTRNIGPKRKPKYVPLCTYREAFIANKWRRNFDVRYCNPSASENGIADTVFYTLKYMLKPSDRETRLQQALRLNLPPDEYEDIWSLIRCRSFYTTGFGLCSPYERDFKQQIKPDPDVESYIRSCIKRSIQSQSPYPCFYSPLTGQSFPLARYYCNKFLTLAEQYEFYYINCPDLEEPYFQRESLAYSELMCKLENTSRILKNLTFSNDDYLDDLCQ